jgi:hypothetical protein
MGSQFQGSQMRSKSAATSSAANQAPRAPALPWFWTWLCALLAVATSLGSLEAFWRDRGFRPKVRDSFDLWAYHRSQVVGGDPSLLVAIGTSRIRSDISPAAVSDCLPGFRLVQLGLNGAMSRIGLLEEISRVPGFCGTVLCDALPPMLDERNWVHRSKSDGVPAPQPILRSARFYNAIRESLIIADEEFSLRGCLQATSHAAQLSGRLEYSQYFRVHADRSMTLDCVSDREMAKVRAARWHDHVDLFRGVRRYANLDEFAESLAPLAEVVATIHRNHGRVVFLRLPSSGRELQLEESTFPSTDYYGVVAKTTSAPCIDFRSLPHGPNYFCPDESHLSPESADVFTKDLVAEMQRRRITGPAISPLSPGRE